MINNQHGVKPKGIVQELTKANDGGDGGKIGIADALRDGQTGDGDAGNEVSFEEIEGVTRSPLEEGNEVFKPEKNLGSYGLVFELFERVIGEEGFFEVGA